MINVKKILAALMLPCAVSAAWADPVEWAVVDGGNGHRYEYVDALVTWDDAFAYAASRGGYLATITSAQEDAFVAALAPRTLGGRGVWLGASDAASEGVWVWQNGPEIGQVLTYTNWTTGEPNNGNGNENYLIGHWWWSTQWNDVNGIELGNAGGMFIEYEAAPVPEPMPLSMVLAGLALLGGVTRRSRR